VRSRRIWSVVSAVQEAARRSSRPARPRAAEASRRVRRPRSWRTERATNVALGRREEPAQRGRAAFLAHQAPDHRGLTRLEARLVRRGRPVAGEARAQGREPPECLLDVARPRHQREQGTEEGRVPVLLDERDHVVVVPLRGAPARAARRLAPGPRSRRPARRNRRVAAATRAGHRCSSAATTAAVRIMPSLRRPRTPFAFMGGGEARNTSFPGPARSCAPEASPSSSGTTGDSPSPEPTLPRETGLLRRWRVHDEHTRHELDRDRRDIPVKTLPPVKTPSWTSLWEEERCS